MESTVPTLWRMIYEKECKTIVVLYGLKESTEVCSKNDLFSPKISFFESSFSKMPQT